MILNPLKSFWNKESMNVLKILLFKIYSFWNIARKLDKDSPFKFN